MDYAPVPVKICIPLGNGREKVIAADVNGGVTCKRSHADSDDSNGDANSLKDDQWVFTRVPEYLLAPIPGIPVEKEGFNIISANFKLVLEYDPTTGEQISVAPYNEIDRNHTIWYVSLNNEIYTYDREGNKKYLWSLAGNLYVTHDEYLAETWKAIPMTEGHEGENLTPLSSSRKSEEISGKILLLIIGVLFAYLMYSVYSGRRSRR